ncbi:MAG: DUF1211 domain-containing protein [Thermoplasmata archaeon]|nr:DUF1211 domain-containing protein [Thermoplasmata archaeon]
MAPEVSLLEEEKATGRHAGRHSRDIAVPDDLTRLVSLSDGIFAFSMTLLVLNLVVPAASSVSSQRDLWGHLGALLQGPFEVYALGFVVTAVWWRLHVAVFRGIRAVDSTILWLDVVFLLFIGVNPFALNLLTRFGTSTVGSTPALVFYAGVQLMVGLCGAAIRLHCSRRPELCKGAPPNAKQVRSLFVTPAVFALSVGAAFLSIYLTYGLWFGAAILGRYIRRASSPEEGRLETGEIGENL